jgi:hypothetical protein
MAKKVDLTLVKKLIGELEASLEAADGIKTAKGDVTDYIVELSKSAGLAAGVMQEASMLVMDVQAQAMAVQNPAPPKTDVLEKLLGPLKGGSGSN